MEFWAADLPFTSIFILFGLLGAARKTRVEDAENKKDGETIE